MMQVPGSPDGLLEMDSLGKFIEFRLPPNITDGRGLAKLEIGDPWGGAIIRWDACMDAAGNSFTELSTGYRLSSATFTTAMDLTDVVWLRAVVQTVSTTAGAKARVSLHVSNPNYR